MKIRLLKFTHGFDYHLSFHALVKVGIKSLRKILSEKVAEGVNLNIVFYTWVQESQSACQVIIPD